MNKEKIKVAFIYKKSYIFLSGKHFDNTMYYFFMHALKKNNRLDVTYFPCENNFDVIEFKDKFDIILLPDNYEMGTPESINGIENLKIPVICRVGDPHDAKKTGKISNHEKYKIDYYFNFMHESYFHRFYPKHFKYKTIIFGLEPSLYQNLKPFKDRIKNRILNSGIVGKTHLPYKIAASILHPHNNMWYFYKLRTMCNELSYVDHSRKKGQDVHSKEDYTTYLSKYRAAIAATTFYPTIKYFETTAAGCLTFMEITDLNKGEYLGYKDKKTAIFINEKNYKDKFQEYLQSADNPEWEEIASAGRDYTINELNNDKAVDSLADLMEELL